MYFAENVKYLMHKKEWNKAALARVTKISPQQVGRYLNGERQPKIEIAIAIAKALDVNLDDMILKDLSQEAGRPFGAEGEDVAEADATLARMNELLEQRILVIERALKKENPDLARDLGIE